MYGKRGLAPDATFQRFRGAICASFRCSGVARSRARTNRFRPPQAAARPCAGSAWAALSEGGSRCAVLTRPMVGC